ncbi:hypothetical protein HOY82DRAFT_480508 [Tuber indicum]|nr:hypothetical protein HOY82DRAFT_480508 [Tuber indicum]
MEYCASISDCGYVAVITNRFTIPTDSGGVPAVAVGIEWVSPIISAYTLMTLCITLLGWGVIVALFVAFSPKNPRSSRYVSLIVIWNSNGPSSAALMMLEHCKRIEAEMKRTRRNKDLEESRSNNQNDITDDQENNRGQPSKKHPTRSPETRKHAYRNLWWGYLFFFISYALWFGHLLASLFITRGLKMGNYAPVNPNHIFYPNMSTFFSRSDSMEGLEKFSIWKHPSAIRALGAVESSNLTVMERVLTKRLDPPVAQTTSPWAGLRYSYNLTGVDMGLQSDPKLKLKVEGLCHTDYTWLVNSTDEVDTYMIWGRKNETFEVRPKNESNLPPVLEFFINTERVNENPYNTSYAMIINTAGYRSKTPSKDPWYATENFSTNETGLELYKILPKRPVLSCWETKRWRLNGEEVETARLKELPGLNLHRFWIDNVFSYEFEDPEVFNMGLIAGSSARKSSITESSLSSLYNFYILDSTSFGVLDDLERLVKASWVRGGNVLRDTTTYNFRVMENSARREDGSVDPAIGQFVLESRDVGTMAVKHLLSVPITLVILLIVRLSLAAWIKHKSLVTLPSIHDLIDDATKSRPGYHNNYVTSDRGGAVMG